MRNDFRPGPGRIQQETILGKILNLARHACPKCGGLTDVYAFKSRPGFAGLACTARRDCSWEGRATHTLNDAGQLVEVACPECNGRGEALYQDGYESGGCPNWVSEPCRSCSPAKEMVN